MLDKFLDPKNDFAFKKIFGSEDHKDILIHFLNDILAFEGSDVIETVEFLNPVQNPEIAYKKQSIVDVLCRDAKGVQYIIEMQVAKKKGFEQRAQFYAAKAYGRQANVGDKYHALKEVIFIAIADCLLFPEKVNYKSDHVILDKETYEHDLKDFSFTFIELPKFTKKLGDPLKGMLERWCYFFKYAPETHEKDLAAIIGQHTILKEAYHALDRHYWSEREYLSYEEEQKRVMDERAILEQAQDQGREEGWQKGRQEASIDIARCLLKRGMPLEEIVQITGLTQEAITHLQ